MGEVAEHSEVGVGGAAAKFSASVLPTQSALRADSSPRGEHPDGSLLILGVPGLGRSAFAALEAARGAAATAAKTLRVGSGATSLFVHPGSGHSFQAVDHLITNFHLPESTLLMLVCAFAGTERVLAAYRHAVTQRYRFFSYGDAMLLHRL